jgi:membrane protein required for colicin V production
MLMISPGHSVDAIMQTVTAWNWLDWTMVLIVFVSALMAFMTGFIRELVSLAALILAVVVASLGYHHAATWFEDLTKSPEIALGLGFIVLFLGVVLIGHLLSSLLKRTVNKLKLQGFDRLLGGAFGFARGLVIDAVLLLIMVAFAIKPAAVEGSVFAPYVMAGARVIAAGMPGELKDKAKAGFDRVRAAIASRSSASPASPVTPNPVATPANGKPASY